jgi:hypothetical protein
VHWGGQYGFDTIYDENNNLFFNEKNTVFSTQRFWHMTHLRRSKNVEDDYSSGGNRIQYAVDVDLECTYTEKWKVGGGSDDESGTEIGKKIHWVTGSTAGNAAPGMETISYLRYGIGIDEIYELFDLAKTAGWNSRDTK